MKKLLCIIAFILLLLQAGAQSVVCTSDAYKFFKLDPACLCFVRDTEIIYDTTVITVTMTGIRVVKQHMNVADRDYGVQDLVTEYKYYEQPYTIEDYPAALFCRLIPIKGEQKPIKCVIFPVSEIPDIRFIFEREGEVYVLTFKLVNFESNKQ